MRHGVFKDLKNFRHMHMCIILLGGFFVIAQSQNLVLSQELDSSSDSTVDLGIKPLEDPWFSADKILHFSASAAITGLTYHFYVNRLNRPEDRGKVYSVSLTALVSIGKELYDTKKKGCFSWKDLLWDGLGLAAGYFVFVY
jgi:uncharacterized protein YfiM (DUF2279 family)